MTEKKKKRVIEPGTVLRPMRAIREKCLDCCGGNAAEVRRCHITECTLHPYRMGHRPKKEKDAPTGDILDAKRPDKVNTPKEREKAKNATPDGSTAECERITGRGVSAGNRETG